MRRASSPRARRPPSLVLPEIGAAEVAGPGLPELRVSDAFLGEALAEIGPGYGGGSAATAANASRSSWSRRTRPGRSRSPRPANGASATASRACSSSPATSVEREYYYNDAGAPDGSLPRVGRGAPRRPATVPRTATRAATSPSSPPTTATRCRGCSSASRRRWSAFASTSTTWARQSELEQGLGELSRDLPTYEADGALFVRSTEFGDEKDRVLIRSAGRGGLSDLRGGGCRLSA